MDRQITGFFKDENGDWVARLDCEHGQHVRHKPPFVNRPWVESASGREDMIGHPLNCVLCDRLEFPDDMSLFKRTDVFDERSMPRYLIQGHRLDQGVWAKMVVTEGMLSYTRLFPYKIREILANNNEAIISPNQTFSLKPIEKVKFYIELYSSDR